MMTTTVGIRELKRDAARLVRRAGLGESVLITRYGKPAALLTSAASVKGRDESPRMRAWRKERDAFERLAPSLGLKYRGRYVAVHGGRVVAAGSRPDELAWRTLKRLGSVVFYVGRVGAPPDLVDMPGFSLE